MRKLTVRGAHQLPGFKKTVLFFTLELFKKKAQGPFLVLIGVVFVKTKQFHMDVLVEIHNKDYINFCFRIPKLYKTHFDADLSKLKTK
jgi:hypothetical protein